MPSSSRLRASIMSRDERRLSILCEETLGAGGRCPCCFVRMRNQHRAPAGKPMPWDLRTIGHDVALSHGGDGRVFVYICNRCNTDQGSLSFAVWARKLILAGDKRGEAVANLADFVKRNTEDWDW